MAIGIKLAGSSAVIVMAVVAGAPAVTATAATPSVREVPAAASAPEACSISTSPLRSCSAHVAAPPGRITLGQTIHLSMSGLKPSTKVSFLVHHLKASKAGTGSAGTVSLSYKPTKVGTVVMSVSGKSVSGKGFGKTFTTLVVGPAKGHAKAHDLTVDISGASATPTPAVAPIVDTSLSSARSLPSSGVSLDAGDISLLAVALLGTAGCVGGLVISGRVGKRS